MRSRAKALIGFLFAATALHAQVTPAPGSQLRKAILEAVRKPVSKSLRNRPVLVQVDHMIVQNDWAFVKGRPLQPNGKPFNYKGTQYQEFIDQGVFDDWFCALARREKGKWVVKAWTLGATDVPWVDWPERFRAPRSVFPPFG